GNVIYGAAEPLVQKSRHHNHMHFLAHGMGLVSHEAPRLTATGPVPYDPYDASRPLESGMVVSVETTLQHPQRGFIKLEDTVVVTATGFDIYGEGGRGCPPGRAVMCGGGGGGAGIAAALRCAEVSCAGFFCAWPNHSWPDALGIRPENSSRGRLRAAFKCS